MVRETEQGLTFMVRVQPRSAKNQIVGIQGNALKVKLTAPPVDGAANAMCTQYLARCLKVKKSAVEILSGHTARTKRILVHCPRDASDASDASAIKRLRQAVNSLFT